MPPSLNVVLDSLPFLLQGTLNTAAIVLGAMLLGLVLGSGLAVTPGVIAGLLWASWMLPLLVHEMLGVSSRLLRASAGR